MPILSVLDDVVCEFEPVAGGNNSNHRGFFAWLHRHSLLVFSILLLIVGSSAVLVGNLYWTAHNKIELNSKPGYHIPARPLQGPNTVVATPELKETVKNIASQPLSLTVGDKSIAIKPEIIQSWLQIGSDKSTGASYIHVSEAAITKSIGEATAQVVKAPVNQVSISHADGSNYIISAGRNGTKIGDASAAVGQIRQSLLSAKGMQLTLPTETQAFASTTPADFAKLIEVNVSTKQMYMYDKGTLTRSYPISAGAPATPTVIGQFKIYQKLPIQTMRGFNVDGTKYVQPNVRWVNYFQTGGYAIHGNYWRPLSWFGAINSSHGCVSLPEDQAKWVYDWAPLGTTVITHY